MTTKSKDKLNAILWKKTIWPKAVPFDEIVKKLWVLISRIEAGYPFSSDDYNYQVAYREMVASAMTEADGEVAEEAQAILQPLDDRFFALTNPVDDLPIGSGPWEDRIPKRLIGELANDISEMRRARDDPYWQDYLRRLGA
ncbi:hypothetical protein [Fimbriimonas ginsengisoli]|uniref:hypothetical protein n=1 Tax=Fimbriimonas ginsengisoli TaxID=1005039 RepID=UPI00046CC039|nr:hypothetical protein [Fimbriimonas ginsengisoli]